jgi:hypothetical protein
MYYVLLIIAIIVLGYLAYRFYKKANTLDQKNNRFASALKSLKQQTLYEHIYQAIDTMDSTYTIYSDEDEANRELTTCLNLLGHTAKYHKSLDNGRTTDISVDRFAIIEGKLDPSQSDIDRLIGQMQDYLQTSYQIYIVIYGQINQTVVDRINSQIINNHADQISLIYLNQANRVRK